MVAEGPVGFIHADLEHNDRRPLEHCIATHNRYWTLEACAILRQEHHDWGDMYPQGASEDRSNGATGSSATTTRGCRPRSHFSSFRRTP
jgi:hypothetical protein